GEVSAHQPPEVAFMEHEDVVQTLTADRADEPLHEGILPGRPWGDEEFANPHGPDSPDELLAVDTVTITKQVGRSRIIRKRFDELPSGPDGHGVVRGVDMEEFAAVVAEDDEDEQQAERQGRHEEEVHGDDLPGMRGQKGAPGGRWSR